MERCDVMSVNLKSNCPLSKTGCCVKAKELNLSYYLKHVCECMFFSSICLGQQKIINVVPTQ